MQTLPERLKRDEWFDDSETRYYFADFDGWSVSVSDGDAGITSAAETDGGLPLTGNERTSADSILAAYRAALVAAAARFRAMAAEAEAELATLDAS